MSKDKSAPAFLFYPDDFSCDGKVEAMTTEEVGAYILLLCKAWREIPPGSIPNDDAVLGRWTRLTPDRWAECKPRVMAAFSLGTDSRWHQSRMRKEYEALMQSRKKRIAAAVKASLSRWSSGSDAQRIPFVSQTHTVPIGDGDGKGIQSFEERESEGKPNSRFLPASESEAVEWAGMVGVPPEFASEAYHKLLGRGWRDGANIEIVNWQGHIKSRWERQRHEWKPGGAVKPERQLTPHDLKTIITAKEAVANQLKVKHASEVAMGTNWDSEERRLEYLTVRREIRELNTRLSKLA